ncbi:hypothetical protein Q604_UNBc4C00221G0002, partial [human gut metagenome]
TSRQSSFFSMTAPNDFIASTVAIISSEKSIFDNQGIKYSYNFDFLWL